MKAIFCYNFSRFFVSHRLPMLMKIKKEFSEISFLGHILDEDKKILNDNFNYNYDTGILKGSTNIFFITRYLFTHKFPNLKKINNFDLIEIATLKGLIYALPIIIKNKNAKVVIWVCGIGTIFISKKFKHKIISQIFFVLYEIVNKLRNTNWIFENNDDRNLFKKRIKIDDSKLSIIEGSGYEINEISNNKKIRSSHKNKIVFIGRLIRDKGLIEFIEAAKLILKKNTEWSFEIIGHYDDNPSSLDEPDLLKHINNSQILIKGFIKDMSEYYEDVFCVVLPSYREGLSRVLIEAGAHSIPSITTNVPGCRDIIKNNVNGFIVEPKSINELESAIFRLISDKDKARSMGAKAFKIFNEKYSLGKIANLTLDIYSKK
tara:strand:- start:416 stop:1540 length:1125 start_codon:yes stop_codon:yes gene_type:complete